LTTSYLPKIGNRLFNFRLLESSNNYAIEWLQKGLAWHGDVIVTQTQTKGRGQQQNQWYDKPGQSLLCSIILTELPNDWQPLTLNFVVPVLIVKILKKYLPDAVVSIKWPNDILINDKKTAGLLIETQWTSGHFKHAVVGLGLNVNNNTPPCDYKSFTSLSMVSGQQFSIDVILKDLIEAWNTASAQVDWMNLYNAFLYKKDAQQTFKHNGRLVNYTIQSVDEWGRLCVTDEAGLTYKLLHGQQEWVWSK
jgi:BirA family biotin operon repressor/biotin-[acetyl-CoA-carboxylase] ligase